jgi:hypothetical protein
MILPQLDTRRRTRGPRVWLDPNPQAGIGLAQRELEGSG